MKDATLKKLCAGHKKRNRPEWEVLIADLGEFLPVRLTVGSNSYSGRL